MKMSVILINDKVDSGFVDKYISTFPVYPVLTAGQSSRITSSIS